MHYVNLGRTGLKVSRICLGMMSYGTPQWRSWVLDEEPSRPFIRRALELGINFFDTANMYSNGMSEEVTGRLVLDYAKRDEVVIATKVFFPTGEKPNQGGLSRKHILTEIDNSLRRLGTDYVDLYQIHRWDPTTPIEETMETLHEVVKSGKARYIGASSMWAWQFAKAQYTADLHGWTRFSSMQNHYNLIYREEEREMIPFCLDQGVALIPWSPLARGLLTGSRTPDKSGDTTRAKDDPLADSLYYREGDFDIIERVVRLAAERATTPAQIALAWLLHQRGVVSPIIGATQLAHLEEAVAALEVDLSEADLRHLEELYQPHIVSGHR